MEMNHLPDEDIQLYAMTPNESPESIALHIRSCEQCSYQVNIYKRIFENIAVLPVPAIDVEGIAQSLEGKSPIGYIKPPTKLLVFLSIISLLFLFFGILLLSGKLFLSGTLVSGVEPLYPVVFIFAILAITFQLLDYMRRYKTLIKTLNNL